MDKKLAKAAVISAASDESALEWARRRLLELMGPRGWHDTHESLMARVAKKLAMNPRRVRAIVQQERHTKVSGDEILAIQRAMDSLAALAHAADQLANQPAQPAGAGSVRENAAHQPATRRSQP